MHGSDTLADRFSQLAQETPDLRRVDLELRMLDVTLSAFFLLVSLPLTIPIGIANLLSSGRPVFYRGQRVGRGGRVFTMTKFRTLRPGAEARIGHHLGTELVQQTESEVTKLGRWLRATQLDEIPQFWNVLRGDMARFGVRPPKLLQYPGLKEEYYLYDFEPDRSVLDELLVSRERILVVVRTPPDVSLYHRRSNPFFPRLLAYLGSESGVHAVVLPRSPEQRDYVRSLALPSLIVPDQAVDAQSLIALADLVVSAGGTMNREAAALGVPVYTTYGGRIGGVDEMLIRDGRLRPLTDPRALELEKRVPGETERVRRDPQIMLDLLLSARERG